MKINGRDFRLFGKEDERPLCLVLLSEKIAENGQDAAAGIPGGTEAAEKDSQVRPAEGEGR